MVSQLCLAYGWRLEQIAIRPEYLQWITSVPPTTSPGYLMRILRQQTSERIFDAFSTLRKDNPSGDFWAPGYLIMSGSQLPPAQIVKEFIQQTRQQQGAYLPSRPKA
jgi:REP element-mobilizing transposase RayT